MESNSFEANALKNIHRKSGSLEFMSLVAEDFDFLRKNHKQGFVYQRLEEIENSPGFYIWKTIRNPLHTPELFLENCFYRVHPHNDVIQAFKSGEKIEYICDHDFLGNPIFCDCEKPSFDIDIFYRVKK